MLSNYPYFSKTSFKKCEGNVGIIQLLRFLTLVMFFMGCQNDNEVESPKKTADQYFNQLKNDASFEALREEIKNIANEAKLSNVHFYNGSPEDLKKLEFATGSSKENLLLKFTNNPEFVIKREDKLRMLLLDFAEKHMDFVKEDSKLIDGVYSKLLNFESDRLIQALKAAKKPDCGGSCNNQYYGTMEGCAFTYDLSFAALILAVSSGGGSVGALVGYVIIEAQRSNCQSGALTSLGYCFDGCAGGNNATSTGTKDE